MRLKPVQDCPRNPDKIEKRHRLQGWKSGIFAGLKEESEFLLNGFANA